jgi:hypothetical protein
VPADHPLCSRERIAFEQPGPPIELRAIGAEPLTWQIALVWRVARRQTPAGKAFIAVALDYAKRSERRGCARPDAVAAVGIRRGACARARPA